jgi:lysophospholipase L1-like esterase
MTAEAVANGCELLSSSSVDVVTAINAYVNATSRGDEADAQTKAQAAVDSLNRAADSVANSLNGPLLPAVADAFGAWVDATRAVGKAIGERYAQQEFNTDVNKFNEANANALSMCGGSG